LWQGRGKLEVGLLSWGRALGGAGGWWAGRSGCFVAGTAVVMADGSSMPIEQVKVGNQVLARDENLQRFSAVPTGLGQSHRPVPSAEALG
jgi:hypothetical protein